MMKTCKYRTEICAPSCARSQIEGFLLNVDCESSYEKGEKVLFNEQESLLFKEIKLRPLLK